MDEKSEHPLAHKLRCKYPEHKVLEDHDLLIELKTSFEHLTDRVDMALDDHEARIRQSEKKVEKILHYGVVLFILANLVMQIVIKKYF